MGTRTKLINATRRVIEIREFLVVYPTEHPGNIYSSVIRLRAGANTRVDGRRYLNTDGQVSISSKQSLHFF
ncbi:hypothetical protein RHGRI_005453 [Rhododendron griersonianum]|uniref:Uncharacterized protein n=1 Tax=Rhododendron griersonianum TaxID=479676 RepID=A0AAV6LDL5_9ERIC|nr:hypothetical protein RHGRI_005453 [Rhododendron griersonianum]